MNLKNQESIYKNCRTIISKILNNTTNIGHINLSRDDDGIAREIQPFVVYKDWAIKHPEVKLGQTNEEIISNPLIIKRIQEEVDHYNQKFGNWEQIKRFEYPFERSSDSGY